MKIIKYYKSDGYWIDTDGYDYSKLKVGDKVVCVNSTVLLLSSMARFGEVYEIKEIKPDDLWMNSWLENKYRFGYTTTVCGIEKTYLGTIDFDRTYVYTHDTLVQTHTDWIQRFVLEDDYKIFIREHKLERILK
jgi:hypothetical protein